MNSINLLGRITNDLELVKGKKGEYAYVRFSLAVRDGVDKDGEQLTQFIPCIAWNSYAETITNYCKKGDRLAIEGKLNLQKYEDDNEETRTSVQVVVQKLHLIESKEKSSDSKSYKRKR